MCDNILEMPEVLTLVAPTVWRPNECWFDHESHQENTDRLIIQSLLSIGVGDRICPAKAEWVAFAVAGGIIANLTGKYLTPPNPEPSGWRNYLEYHVWHVLWKTMCPDIAKLDRVFVASVLRWFLPRPRTEPCVYIASNLALALTDVIVPTDARHTQLNQDFVQRGRFALDDLPIPVNIDVWGVSQHVPAMLEIANSHC